MYDEWKGLKYNLDIALGARDPEPKGTVGQNDGTHGVSVSTSVPGSSTSVDNDVIMNEGNVQELSEIDVLRLRGGVKTGATTSEEGTIGSGSGSGNGSGMDGDRGGMGTNVSDENEDEDSDMNGIDVTV